MTTLAQLHDCDGFDVDAYVGQVGVVEETWVDERGHPVALAVRHAGGRVLLVAEDVARVDPDAREVLVRPGARLLELEPPRLAANGDGRPSASWRTTGAVVELVPTSGPGTEEGVPWRLGLRVFAVIAAIAFVEIGLAFLVPYLVTGRAY